MKSLGWTADDSREVRIAERLLRAEFVGSSFPGEVLPGEEWEGTVTVGSLEEPLGSSPFRLRVVGDVWLYSEPQYVYLPSTRPPYKEWPFWLAHGQPSLQHTMYGRGAQNFSVYLDFFEWVEVDTYHVKIDLAGSAGGAKATSQVRFWLEQTFQEVETDTFEVSVGEYPPGALTNLYLDETGADFPESVGTDEAWSGSIPICNSGPTSFFSVEIDGDDPDPSHRMYGTTNWGVCKSLNIGGTGPTELTIHLYEPKWVEQGRLDVEVPYHRGVVPGVAEGRLANLVVPNDPTYPPISIDIFNAGWEVGTFRLIVERLGEFGPWDIAPLGIQTVEVPVLLDGTYPLALERYTDAGWVLDDELDALVPPMIYIDVEIEDKWDSPAPYAVVELTHRHVGVAAPYSYPFLEDLVDKRVTLDQDGYGRFQIANKVYGGMFIKWMGLRRGAFDNYNPMDLGKQHIRWWKFWPY